MCVGPALGEGAPVGIDVGAVLAGGPMVALGDGPALAPGAGDGGNETGDEEAVGSGEELGDDVSVGEGSSVGSAARTLVAPKVELTNNVAPMTAATTRRLALDVFIA